VRLRWPVEPIDVVTEQDGKRDLVRMRWALVPSLLAESG